MKKDIDDRFIDAFREMGFNLEEMVDGAKRFKDFVHPNGYGFRLLPSGGGSADVVVFRTATRTGISSSKHRTTVKKR